MAGSRIIVESNNDQYFFDALIRFLEKDNCEIQSTEIDWEVQSAEESIEKPTGLKRAILSTFNDITKGKYDKIGIIWDLDTLTKEERIRQFNNAFRLADAESSYSVQFTEMTETNQFVSVVINEVSVDVACHLVNLDGKGEIEDILKAIKTQDSPIADCVDKLLPECLNANHEKELREKDLVKLWINHYIRFDTLVKNNRNQANTKWENVMKKRSDIFDFGKEVKELSEIKEFLNMFMNS
ncbi:MAG: hypothetical protein K1X92_05650 [Bacteroidia bacterium]|nr:hypothetical protein [Bacteroidia bacterium]